MKGRPSWLAFVLYVTFCTEIVKVELLDKLNLNIYNSKKISSIEENHLM